MALTATQITLVSQATTAVTLCAHPVGGIMDDTATYQWYRSTSQGFTPGGGNILSGKTSRTLTDTGLTGNTIYYYVLRATSGMDTVDYPEFDVLTLGAAVGLPTVHASSSFAGTNNTLAGEIDGADGWTLAVAGTNRRAIVTFSNVIDPDAGVVAYLGSLPMMPIHRAGGTVVFEINNPPIGTHAVTMKWGHVAGSYEPVGIAVALKDCDTIVQRGLVFKAGGTGTTASVSVDTASGELVVGIVTAGSMPSEGAGLTNVASQVGNLYGFGNIRVAKAEQSSLTWTLSSGEWTVLAFSQKPVGATGTRPLPMIERFEERMVIGAAGQAGAAMTALEHWDIDPDPGDPYIQTVWGENGDYTYYYSGTKVLYDIGDYLGVTTYDEGAATQLYIHDQAYMAPESYNIPTYNRAFTDSPYVDYLNTSDANDLVIIDGLRDNTSYAGDGDTALEGIYYARENAYHLMSQQNGELVGLTARPTKHAEVLANAKDHMVQWFDELAWVGVNVQFSPFIVGLTAEALIRNHATTGDAEIVTLIKNACDYLWNDAWHTDTLGMLYQLNDDASSGPGGQDGPRRTVGSPNLNNLIAKMYAWLAVQTGDQAQMDRAEWLFAGNAMNGYYIYGKQFNQAHWFTMGDTGTLATRDLFYAEEAAPVTYSTTILADSPEAYLRLGEASGTLLDETANNHDATASGSPTYGATGLITNDADDAMTFDGTDDTAAFAASTEFNFERTQAWTIECLVKPNAPRSVDFEGHAILSKLENSGNYRGFELMLQYQATPGQVRPVVFISSVLGSSAIEKWFHTDLANGTTYHLVVTYDGSSTCAGVRCWVNGVEITSVTNNRDHLSSTIQNSITPHIGSRSNATVHGKFTLDELAVYTTALTEKQIRLHYAYSKNLDRFTPSAGVRVIFDTDNNTDVGDAGALAMLHNLQTLGYCTLLCVNTSVADAEAPEATAAMNYYYGRDTLKVGYYASNASVTSESWVGEVSAGFDWKDNTGTLNPGSPSWTDPVTLYRQYLAAAPDGSVRIICVGFTKNLARLLASSADGYSALNGSDLVAAKCELLVVMGGCYDGSVTGLPNDAEWNFYHDPSSAHDLCANWPSAVPIIFTGFEIGPDIESGQLLAYEDIALNPVKYAFNDAGYLTNGRDSWDQVAAMIGAMGLLHDGKLWLDLVEGTNAVNASTGVNTFTPGSGSQYYTEQLAADADFEARFNDLMFEHTMLTDVTARWSLDEASGTRADSIGSHNLTDNNTVLSGTGKLSDAADFEAGNSEYLSVSSASTLKPNSTKGFTFGAWIKLESLGAGVYPVIASKGWANSGTSREWVLFVDGDTSLLNLHVQGATTTTTETGSTFGALSNGVWYYVEGWYDDALDVIGVSVNGVIDTTARTEDLSDTSSDFVIGASPTQSLYFDGLIDEAFFQQRPSTQWERLRRYGDGDGLAFTEWDETQESGPLTAGTASLNSKTDTSITIDWTNPTGIGAGASTHQLQIDDGGGWEDVTGETVSPGEATGLTAETEYGLRVKYTSGDDTVYSNTVTVTTDATPATTITITGPSTIVANVPRNYTYTPDGDADGVTVTPTTDGTGTFDPASDTFVGSTPLVFEYTATDFADSPHTLGSTDDGGLTNGTKVVTVLETAPDVEIAPILVAIGVI